MEHTTFAKKTVVLAALGALSLMAATVRADETDTPSTPDAKSITVTIGVQMIKTLPRKSKAKAVTLRGTKPGLTNTRRKVRPSAA